MREDITPQRRAFAVVLALALAGFAVYLLVQDSVAMNQRGGRPPLMFTGTAQLLLCLSIASGAVGVWRFAYDRMVARPMMIIGVGCGLLVAAILKARGLV